MPLVLIIPRWNKRMVFIYSDGCISDDENDNKSKLKVELGDMGKKHHLILDAKLPPWNNLSTPYYIRFLNVNKDAEHEHRESKGLTISCRTSSLASIPIGIMSSETFIESLRRCRRTRSANDVGDMFVEQASVVAGSGDVTVSPSPRCVVARSLFFQLGTLDAATRPFRATSFTFSQMKSSDLTASPLDASSPLSPGPGFVATSPVSQISSLKRSESLLVPCSSSNSTGSYQSNSTNLTVSKGTIYCIRKNGSWNLLFKEDGDKGKRFTTNVHKIVGESVDMAVDYVYTFRSVTGNKASEYVGMMRVFSSLILNPGRSRSIETEFVLFGAEEHPNEAASSAIKIHGLSKKVAKMFRSNNSSKDKDVRRMGEFEGSESASRPENGRRPSLELAAILVRSSPNCVENEADTSGWGLKFLERVVSLVTDHADTSENENGKTSRDTGIDVLIPAGFHGSPITGDGGPSSLVERWRSGGHCDCGGWDVGCPLMVLHGRNSTAPMAFHTEYSEEDGQTVVLFIEGAKHAEPELKMVMAAEGVYTVYFRPTLSALQAFSVGAAIIHSRTPELHPKL